MTNPNNAGVPATFALFDQTKKWGNFGIFFHDPCCANRALTIGGFLACNNWPSDLRSLRCTGHSGRSGFGRLGCFSHLAIRGRGAASSRGGCAKDVPKSRSDNRQTTNDKGNKKNKDKEDQNIRKLKQSQGKLLRTSVVTKWFDF